jgi:hypothetical protein
MTFRGTEECCDGDRLDDICQEVFHILRRHRRLSSFHAASRTCASFGRIVGAIYVHAIFWSLLN